MIEIRRVRAADWTLLRTTRLAALQDTPHVFGSTYKREAAFDEATWRERAASNGTFFALDQSVSVGLATGFLDETECEPHERLLVSMWVAPDHRGTGLAGRLIEHVVEWARADGATALCLDITADNDAARRAYERAGFVATGRRLPMPRDPAILQVRMTLAL